MIMKNLNVSRRKLLRTGTLFTAGLIAAPWNSFGKQINATGNLLTGLPEPAGSQVTQLASNVFFRQGKTAYFLNGNLKEIECNNGWIIFEDFVLLIDSNMPATAPALQAAIRATTNKPIKLVFNTHHHGDHVYGNKYWAEQGATIIASKGLANELQQHETGYYGKGSGRWEDMAAKRDDVRNLPLLPPQLIFEDKFVIQDKSSRVELLQVGTGHTKGDGVAWLPKEKIMFTGDACLNDPYNNLRDAHIYSWINTLEKLKAYDANILVPGHGRSGNFATIGHQQQYLRMLYAWVKSQKQGQISWATLRQRLPDLRQLLVKDAVASRYLVPEPPIIPMWSLEAHAQKVFDEIN